MMSVIIFHATREMNDGWHIVSFHMYYANETPENTRDANEGKSNHYDRILRYIGFVYE
jgi:hypothetical protein